MRTRSAQCGGIFYKGASAGMRTGGNGASVERNGWMAAAMRARLALWGNLRQRRIGGAARGEEQK